MSTIKDFENAPIGATATHDKGTRVMKTGDVGRNWVTPGGSHLDKKEMVYWGYTLDRTAPTTAREALDLAWELAYPVKEGQLVPAGTECILRFFDGELYATKTDDTADSSKYLGQELRTLDPLREPLSDWLDAPAVLAWSKLDDLRTEKVWTEVDAGEYRSPDGETVPWTDLENVTPLYPKEME